MEDKEMNSDKKKEKIMTRMRRSTGFKFFLIIISCIMVLNIFCSVLAKIYVFDESNQYYVKGSNLTEMIFKENAEVYLRNSIWVEGLQDEDFCTSIVENYNVAFEVVKGEQVEKFGIISENNHMIEFNVYREGRLEDIASEEAQADPQSYGYEKIERESESSDFYVRTVQIKAYIDMDFPKLDTLSARYRFLDMVVNCDSFYIPIAIVSALIIIIIIIFLLMSAGMTKKDKRSILLKMPFDLLSIITFILACCVFVFSIQIFYYASMYQLLIGCITTMFVGLIYIMAFIARVRDKSLFSGTITYKLGKLVLANATLSIKFALLYSLFCLAQLCVIIITNGMAFFILWINIVVFIVGLYICMMIGKLKKAANGIANGDNKQVNTQYMIGDIKETAEKMGDLSAVIDNAVDEKMKSELFKTELITNVSHDIKTPLTSIINYADLICGEETENENIREYSEVLLRQSNRLKRLIEDLIEASKASTGNLAVNLQPCDVTTFLSQTIGEYSEKLQQSKLELVCTQNVENIKILADSRHLFRVFENLLNNTCKYALEGSRVYVTVEKFGNIVQISFKNVSKYQLNISPEQLLERFVRADESRSSSGNGLGLSIANSLTQIQNGRLNIEIDGDYFKAILTFGEFIG